MQLVSVVMDDPALRRFMGLIGHKANFCCPLCMKATKPEAAEQSFAWPDVTGHAMRNLMRTDSSYRSGLMLLQLNLTYVLRL